MLIPDILINPIISLARKIDRMHTWQKNKQCATMECCTYEWVWRNVFLGRSRCVTRQGYCPESGHLQRPISWLSCPPDAIPQCLQKQKDKCHYIIVPYIYRQHDSLIYTVRGLLCSFPLYVTNSHVRSTFFFCSITTINTKGGGLFFLDCT